MMSYEYPHPASRTYQYKKITKPLLERKRRARINKCLEELKNLMVDALETEGEDVSKLEKADILELTVRHLQRLRGTKSSSVSSRSRDENAEDSVSAESRWLSGFGHCAAEAYRFLSTVPGEGAERLSKHLAAGLQRSRQRSNPSQKTKVLTEILASLNLSADLIAFAMPNAELETVQGTSSNETVRNCENEIRDTVALYVSSGDDEESTGKRTVFNARDSQVEERGSTKNTKTEAKVEDEEEIDVERIDADPMWRPW